MLKEQEEIIFPSLEEWRKLYDAAAEFKKIAPWDWMYDTDMFVVQNPDNEEMGYCCIFGKAEQLFGLAVYLGTEGLEDYLKDISDRSLKDNSYDGRHTKKCLLAAFEDRKYLSKDDLAVIKRLGLHFSGANSWPQFQSWWPGYFPWQLTKSEAVYLTLCLQQAKEIALRFKNSPDMLEATEPNRYFTRLAKKENGVLKWEETFLQPAILRKVVIMRQTIDEERIKKIALLKRQKNMVWEVDFFYSPAYIAEKGKRPYFPVMFLCVEQYSHFILSTHLTPSDKYRVEFVEYCLRAFQTTKIVPAEIQVRKEELLVYLQPFAERLGIDVRLVKKLRALDDVRRDMRRFWDRK